MFAELVWWGARAVVVFRGDGVGTVHAYLVCMTTTKENNMMADRVDNAIAVLELCTLPDGVKVATVACADYDAKCELPGAIRLRGHELGCSGWDSDRCVAFYRSDRVVAVAC